MIAEKKVKKYCKGDITKIENYDKAMSDDEFVWHCHHRLEERGLTKKYLIEQDLYFNRPPEELIFLHPAEHFKLHGKECTDGLLNRYRCDRNVSDYTRHKLSKSRKGKKFSEEHRKHISEVTKGEKNGMYGKHHSEEIRQKISEAVKAYLQRRKQQIS